MVLGGFGGHILGNRKRNLWKLILSLRIIIVDVIVASTMMVMMMMIVSLVLFRRWSRLWKYQKMKFSPYKSDEGEGMRMEDEDALGDIDGDDEEDL